MGEFNVQKYNQLLDIDAADALFEKQLSSAGLTRPELFMRLNPLFLGGGQASRYSPCLIHHHFLLEEGERMVSYGRVSRPTKNKSPNIIPECWLNTGEEIEHRLVDDPKSAHPAPSADFFARFKAIVDEYGIDILGVCYAPEIDELAPGFIFFETLVPETREQIVDIIPESSKSPREIVQASWILKPQGECVYKKGCQSCTGCQSHTYKTTLKTSDSDV